MTLLMTTHHSPKNNSGDSCFSLVIPHSLNSVGDTLCFMPFLNAKVWKLSFGFGNVLKVQSGWWAAGRSGLCCTGHQLIGAAWPKDV